MAKIICPNKEYSGVSGGVRFVKGEGETDNKRLISWFKKKGYKVEENPLNASPTDTPKNLEDMSVKELQAFAAENDIDIAGVKKKDDILGKIKVALAERGSNGDENSNDNDEGNDSNDEEIDEDS